MYVAEESPAETRASQPIRRVALVVAPRGLASRPVRDLSEQPDTVLEGLAERLPDARRWAPGPRLLAAASPRHQGPAVWLGNRRFPR